MKAKGRKLRTVESPFKHRALPVGREQSKNQRMASTPRAKTASAEIGEPSRHYHANPVATCPFGCPFITEKIAC